MCNKCMHVRIHVRYKYNNKKPKTYNYFSYEIATNNLVSNHSFVLLCSRYFTVYSTNITNKQQNSIVECTGTSGIDGKQACARPTLIAALMP